MPETTLGVSTWDGHAINDGTSYASGLLQALEWGLPDVQPALVARVGAWPLVGAIERPGRQIVLLVRIVGADRATLRAQLLRWFSPEDETPKRLVVTLDGVSVYVEAVVVACQPKARTDRVFVVTLQVHGDPRWRAVTASTQAWSVTASGQTVVVNNTGTDEAYPVLAITPTSSKSGGYAYKRYIIVRWRAPGAVNRYPVALGPLDTAALVSAGKCQADGDDLRVFIDGAEQYRWLIGMNGATTQIWANFGFMATQTATLKTALSGSGTPDSVEVNEDVAGFPESGALLVDNEVFLYTARSKALKAFSGITRAAWGTSAASHSAGATVEWLQHEVLMVYGNGSATAPATDDDYKPAFDLTASTNTAWDYTEFGDDGNKRGARWEKIGNPTLSGTGGVYTATQRTLATPYSVAGAWLDGSQGNVFGWVLENPCGMTNVAWYNGYKRRAGDSFLAHLMYWVRGASWWTWQYNPTSPSSVDTWESWSYTAGAAFSVADKIGLALYYNASDIEVGRAVVTLNSAQTPVVTIGSEAGNYPLAVTLTNTTTGQALTIALGMATGEAVTVDTGAKTVSYKGASHFQAVALVGAARRAWLPLAVGNNTLQFDDTGTAGVTVAISYARRYV